MFIYIYNHIYKRMQKASNHIFYIYIYKYIHRYFCQICKSSKPMRIGALHCRKRDVIREVCIKDKLMQRPMNTTHTRPLNKLCIRGQLKFLTHLNLRQNLLSGEIPRELGNLKARRAGKGRERWGEDMSVATGGFTARKTWNEPTRLGRP